jgi:hypothetical protein
LSREKTPYLVRLFSGINLPILLRVCAARLTIRRLQALLGQERDIPVKNSAQALALAAAFAGLTAGSTVRLNA